MQDKSLFDPGKLSIVEFKLIKGQVEAPEEYSVENVKGYHLEHSFELGFNVSDKMVKADVFLNIKTESKEISDVEANGNFHFVFIFKVENLEELAILNKTNTGVTIEPNFGTSLAAISYSTSRGILLTRLQGTPLQNFILPVINPDILLEQLNNQRK